MTKRWYGVSHGNGNDGVSHMYADYYVCTDDPWRLAELAVASYFKPAYQQAALDAADIDGEAEYTISATIYSESDVTGVEEESESEDDEDDEEEGDFFDDAPAWLIIEVFPEPDSDWRAKRECPKYTSIKECFSEAELALCAKTEG